MALTELVSCSVIEKDTNGDLLWAWIYPGVSDAQKSVVTRKHNFESATPGETFTCTRYKNDWIYISSQDTLDTDKLPRVKLVAVVIFAKDFHPHLYETLATLLCKTYRRSGKTMDLLNIYLSVFTTGLCESDCGFFDTRTFRDGANNHVDTNVKGLIKTFELETILIYTALLLKKKIVIYHHSLEQLLKWIGTFPALMRHRNITDHLYPWVDLQADELSDLKGNSYYLAGCRDSTVSTRTDIFDLLVNLPAREITVAPHAKESLTMTKTHKEIALFMLQLSENAKLTETQIISEITEKTRDLLNNLLTLATVDSADGQKVVSLEHLKEKNLSPAVENFLVNLAVAENLQVIQ